MNTSIGRTMRLMAHGPRPRLQALPILPEPFDAVVTRTVSADCLVNFEDRQYTVPFALVGQRVEVRGAAGRVQILAGHRIVVRQPRHTAERIVIDPSHYRGLSTTQVVARQSASATGPRGQCGASATSYASASAAIFKPSVMPPA